MYRVWLNVRLGDVCITLEKKMAGWVMGDPDLDSGSEEHMCCGSTCTLP